MSVLKIKDANNNWQSIPAIKGADGRDGYEQYTAGENITIVNNVISASQNLATKSYVDDLIGDINSVLATLTTVEEDE